MLQGLRRTVCCLMPGIGALKMLLRRPGTLKWKKGEYGYGEEDNFSC